jgi:hypothetical protein
MITSSHARGLLADEATRASDDRELLRLAIHAGVPNAARLRQTHPDIFAHSGPPAELPAGWEQRVEKRSGRVFYVDHNTRATCWTDPRRKAKGAAEEGEVSDDEEEQEQEIEEGEEDGEEEELLVQDLESLSIAPPAASASAPAHTEAPIDDPSVAAPSDERTAESAPSAAGAPAASTAVDAPEMLDPDAPPPLLLAIGGRLACRSQPSELNLLSCNVLQPTTERLSRRAFLQHCAARDALLARLPDAAMCGRMHIGYPLLQERRARLIQQVQTALARERERADLEQRSWHEQYERQRQANHAKRGGSFQKKAVST